MLKLVKYEFRKNLTLLFAMIGVIVALEVYFISSILTDSTTNAIISISLLGFASFLAALIVFILGIVSYTRELQQKSSYLIFMTPNSALSIVASKFTFTFLAGFFAAAILAILAYIDFPLMMNQFSEWKGYYALLDMLMTETGLSLGTALMTVLFFIAMIFLALLSTVGVAYFSVTLSATFLQNKKGKGLVSTLLFVALSYGLSRLSSVFVNETLVIHNVTEMMEALSPMLVQNFAVILISLFASAWMLDKRVSL